MKVAVLMLSYNRYELLKKTTSHNLKNAGAPFDLFVWDNGSTDERVIEYLKGLVPAERLFLNRKNFGIAFPFNYLMHLAFSKEYDAVMFMANDIKEPDKWLAKRIAYMTMIPESGMVSVALGSHQCRRKVLRKLPVDAGHVIGQFMISLDTYLKVGSFREDFGLYGPIDNDYNIRCERLGRVNYYIPGIKGEHLDDKDDKKYGYSKSDQVKKTWEQFASDLSRYNDPAACYIPYDGQTTLEMLDYVQQEINGEGGGK